MLRRREFFSRSPSTKNISRQIFVGNVSVTIKNQQKLETFFRKFGEIECVELVNDRDTGEFKRIGFITFTKIMSVVKALSAPRCQLIFAGRVLRVHHAVNQQRVDSSQDEIQTACKTSSSVVSLTGDDEYVCDDTGLNVDCVLHIFSFLSMKEKITCERVCKRWMLIARLSWKSMNSLNFSELTAMRGSGETCPITDTNVRKILKRTNGKVEHVNLALARHITPMLSRIICMYAPRLTHLNLSKTRGIFSKSVCEALGREAKNLKVLNLSECVEITDDSLDSLFYHNPLIQELNLSVGYYYTQLIDGTFMKHAKNLLKLSLQYSVIKPERLGWVVKQCCQTIEELDLRNLDSIPSLAITSLCPNLKKLDISYMGNSVYSRDVPPVRVDLAGACNLEEFIAVYANGFTFDIGNMEELVIRCPNLRKLNFSSNGMILRKGYSPVRVFMKYIVKLKQLTHLDLSYSDLKYSGELEKILKLKKLVSLKLCGSELLFFESAIAYLIEQLPCLTYLDISGIRLSGGHILKETLHNLPGDRSLTLVIGGCCLYALNGIERIEENIKIDRTNNCNWMLRIPYMRGLINARFEEYEENDPPYQLPAVYRRRRRLRQQ